MNAMNSWRLFGEQVRAWGRTSLLLSVRRQHGATAWVDTGQVRPIAQKDARHDARPGVPPCRLRRLRDGAAAR